MQKHFFKDQKTRVPLGAIRKRVLAKAVIDELKEEYGEDVFTTKHFKIAKEMFNKGAEHFEVLTNLQLLVSMPEAA